MRTARLVVGLLLVLATPAGAEPIAEAPPSAISARDFIERGVALRKAGNDRLALAEFERAYALEHSAEALAQIALAEQALGRWLDALEHLESALEVSSEDVWIAKHRATLEAALADIEARFGQLEVSCNVSGAVLRSDGRVLGRTPLERPLRLVAGESVMQIAAEGYFEVTRLVQVDPRSLSRLEVALIPRPSPVESPERALAQAAPVLQPRPSMPAANADSSGANPNSARSILMYTSLGLAAAGVALGTTGYVMREVNVRLYNDDARCARVLGVSRSAECPSEAAGFHRGEVLAIAGFSSAAVFGASGLFLWLNRPPSAKQGALGCAVTGTAVSCLGHF